MKWPTLLLLICGLLIGIFVRGFFPKEVINTVIRTEIEQLPPEVIEKVLTDTLRVTKWKTRIVEKVKYREAVPETVTVYKEKILPERFKALISHLEFHKPSLRYYLYSFQDSTVTLFTHKVKNDFELSIDQVYGVPRVKESRNFFDRPSIYVGYYLDRGLFARISLRIWKPHLLLYADQEGVWPGLEVEVF